MYECGSQGRVWSSPSPLMSTASLTNYLKMNFPQLRSNAMAELGKQTRSQPQMSLSGKVICDAKLYPGNVEDMYSDNRV